METFFTYFIKVSVLVTLFYLSYHFLLKKETFFGKNRMFLLLGLVTALVLPLITITKTVWTEPEPILFNEPVFVPFEEVQTEIISQITEEKTEINWSYIVAGLYFLGALFFLLKFVLSSLSLYKILHKTPIKKLNGYKIIDSPKVKTPFSFFSYIAFDSSSFSEEELQNIITHEKVHSNQKHSLDILLSELFLIAFWFNPFVWLYKKAMVQNLEFIADNYAINQSENPINYQKTLLKITLNLESLALANPFYQPLIKKRIMMLNKIKSKKSQLWKYLVVAPLLVLFVVQFQTKVVAQERKTSNPKTNKILIVNDTVVWVKDFSEGFENEKWVKEFEKGYTEHFVGGATKEEAPLVIINGVEQTMYYPKNLKFEGASQYTHYTGKEAIDKFGQKAKNGAYVIEGEKVKIIPVYPDSKERKVVRGGSWEDVKEHLKPQPENKILGKNPLYIINGKEIYENDFKKLNIETLEFEGGVVITQYSKEEAIEKFGEKAKDGAIVIQAKITNLKMEGSVKSSDNKDLLSFLKTVKDYKQIDIYNRWGNLVYSLKPNEKLDENKLSTLEDGTYFYTFEKSSGEKVSGYLYKGDTADSEQRIKEVQERVKQAEQRAEDAKIRAEDAKQRIKDSEQRVEDAKIRIEDAKQRIKDSEQRIEDSKIRIEEAQKRIEERKIVLKDLDEKNSFSVTINKNTTDKEIKEYIAQFKSQNIEMKVSNIKRNKNREITKIKISLVESSGDKNNKSETKSESTIEYYDQTIPDIFIGKRNGKLVIHS